MIFCLGFPALPAAACCEENKQAYRDVQRNCQDVLATGIIAH